jgi:nitroimidazol reductase NimA-like FMN-containing flavoprotein (pyridoxamine 5'-phosphate oxidase superfamily)
MKAGLSVNCWAGMDVDHVMTQGPAPRPLSDEALSSLLGEQQFGALATVKRSGHPHLTTMLYSWDPEARVVRFSTMPDRVKVGHLRRNPRAALHVPPLSPAGLCRSGCRCSRPCSVR